VVTASRFHGAGGELEGLSVAERGKGVAATVCCYCTVLYEYAAMDRESRVRGRLGGADGYPGYGYHAMLGSMIQSALQH
jgi:hypothetical protein